MSARELPVEVESGGGCSVVSFGAELSLLAILPGSSCVGSTAIADSPADVSESLTNAGAGASANRLSMPNRVSFPSSAPNLSAKAAAADSQS